MVIRVIVIDKITSEPNEIHTFTDFGEFETFYENNIGRVVKITFEGYYIHEVKV